MLFCAYLALQGLRWQTIKSYLSAVRHFQLMQGAPPGSLDGARPRLQLMLRGIKRATSTKPSKARLPITPFILRQMWRAANKNEPSQDTLMLWAAMNMCFFGFLRAGEVCALSGASYDSSWHLCVQDLALDSHINPTKLFVTIKASKTDPFRQGSTVTLGKTDRLLCPISAILPYVAVRGNEAGPLFRFQDGSFLTRDTFVKGVRHLLVATGIDPLPYSGQLRILVAAPIAFALGQRRQWHKQEWMQP